MPSKFLTVPEEADGQRLDQFLAEHLPEYSRSQLQKFIEAGRVGVRKSRQPVRVGESIEINLPELEQTLHPASGDVEILYEDEHLLVVDKPLGIVVHPNSFDEEPSIIQMVIRTRPEIRQVVYDSESEVSRLRPGIVHRLDKDTSGVLLIAKTQEALQHVANQFYEHTVHKEYLTLLSGEMKEAVTIDAPLQRKPGRENMMGIAKDPVEGRAAVTHFTPVGHYLVSGSIPITEVRCVIETGRTHQIRAHAKSLGMPVLGDIRYANKRSEILAHRLNVERQLLHAELLEVNHPKTGQRIKFVSRIPNDMSSVLSALTNLNTAC